MKTNRHAPAREAKPLLVTGLSHPHDVANEIRTVESVAPSFPNHSIPINIIHPGFSGVPTELIGFGIHQSTQPANRSKSTQ